jgi:hypothetical protein
MRLPIALAVILIAAAPVASAGQQIAPQTRVRITLAPQRDVEGREDPQVLRGTLLSMTADSMTLQVHPAATPVTVARTAVRRIDVSRGVPSRVASAAIGGLGGAALGSLALMQDANVTAAGDTAHGSVTKRALAGAAIGGAIGIVSGALYPHERWRRVRIPRGVNVALAAGGGTAVGLSISR